MQTNYYALNDLLIQKLQSNEPFSLLRIDNTAGFVLDCINRGVVPDRQHYNEYTIVEGGVPGNMEYAFNKLWPDTLDAMRQCDILGFVDVSGDIRRSNLIKQFEDKPTFFHKDTAILDPGGLLGYYSEYKKLETPWTQYLKGKKVLAISSHVDSIKFQWEHLDRIWGKDKDKIVPFELVDCIRTPYHPSVDDRQIPGCNTFDSIVDHMKNVIDTYDYDVLLTSVTTQSPFYAEHAKQRGKVGIQTGGTLQLFFGVLGGRWLHSPSFKEWVPMFNEWWIHPFDEDKPQRVIHPNLETNYAYW